MAFTKEQEKAISSQARAVLVVAGPGSGKTTVLTEGLPVRKWLCAFEREGFPGCLLIFQRFMLFACHF